MQKILQELKRRNVIKASVSYLVVGWLIIQVASIVFPVFSLDTELLKWVFIVLAIGFPAWIIFAYIYEWTPSGFKKTDEVAPEQSQRRNTNKKLNAYIISGLSMMVILLLVDRFFEINVSLEDGTRDKSIAILPFENMSASEDAYFASGITEDILTQVSKVGKIRVLSSLSLKDYDVTGKTPDEIGKELGVSHILIGNVRRSEDNLRIGCQLVDTQGEETIWAQTYDKQMSNVFAIQSEIAIEVANSLGATISAKEEIIIEKKPTDNMAALDLLYRGRELSLKVGKKYNEQALILFKEAIVLDPYFSTAYSNLSATYTLGIQDYGNYSRDYLDTALLLAQKAIDLEPDFSMNWHALGLAYSRLGKIEESITMYQKVLELNPNSSSAYNNLANYYSQKGDPVRAIEMYKKGISLEPANSIKSKTEYSNLSAVYWELGLGERAIAAAKRSIEIGETAAGRRQLAISNYVIGDSSAMIDNLNRMISLGQEDAGNMNWATLLYFEYINLETGKKYLERLKGLAYFDTRDFPNTLTYDAYIAFQEGRVDNANAILSRNLDFHLGEIQSGVQFQTYLFNIAAIYAIQNDQEKAVLWLNKLVDDGWLNVTAIQNSRLFENLQDNEGYHKLVDRLQVKVNTLRQEVISNEMNTTLRSF